MSQNPTQRPLDEKALQAAVDAADAASPIGRAYSPGILAAITAYLSALREAAAPSEEPVAWRYRHSEQENWHYGPDRMNWWECQPLFASPAVAPVAVSVKGLERLIDHHVTDDDDRMSLKAAIRSTLPGMLLDPATIEVCARLVEANMLCEAPGGVEILHPRTNPGNKVGQAYADAIRALSTDGEWAVSVKLAKDGEPVTLADCPIGLFESYSGELCLKTEYGNNEGRIDAYIVSSGEFFWGAAPQTIANQRAQLVQPVLSSIIPATKGGEDRDTIKEAVRLARVTSLSAEEIASALRPALAQDTDATPPVAQTGTVTKEPWQIQREACDHSVSRGRGQSHCSACGSALKGALSAPTVEGEGLGARSNRLRQSKRLSEP